jgi:hypothetical protein
MHGSGLTEHVFHLVSKYRYVGTSILAQCLAQCNVSIISPSSWRPFAGVIREKNTALFAATIAPPVVAPLPCLSLAFLTTFSISFACKQCHEVTSENEIVPRI